MSGRARQGRRVLRAIPGVFRFIISTGVIMLFACRPAGGGPQPVAVIFTGPVKLYRLSAADLERLSWGGSWGDSGVEPGDVVPRYVSGRAFGLLLTPSRRPPGSCDPFAGGRLALALDGAGRGRVWSVSLPLEPPHVVPVGASYRLAPGSRVGDRAGGGAGAPPRLPDTPGLWRLTLTWWCADESRGARTDVRFLLVDRSAEDGACDPAVWARVTAAEDRSVEARLAVFDSLPWDTLCLWDRMWLTKYRVQALKSAGQYALAESLALTWADLARRAGFVSEGVLALNAAHEAARDRGDLFAALGYLDRSLALAEALHYDVRFPEEYFSRAWVLSRLGRPLGALEMAAKAEDEAIRMGNRVFRLESWRLRLSLLQSLGHHHRVNHEVEGLIGRLGVRESPSLYNNVGWILLRGLEAGAPLGDDRDAAAGRAVDLFQQALSRMDSSDPYRAGTMGNLALAFLLRGDRDAASDWLFRARQVPAPEDPELLCFLEQVSAELALAEGDYPGAAARFESLETRAGANDLVHYAGAAAFGQGEVLRATGDLEAALRAYDRALAWVEANEAMPSPLHEATLLADQVPWAARAVQVRLDLHRDLDALDLVERFAWTRWRSQARHGRRIRLTPSVEQEVQTLEQTIERLDRAIAAERAVPVPGSGERLRRLQSRREAAWARTEILMGEMPEAAPPPLRLAALASRLPPGAALVRPAALPEELVVWTVRNGRLSVRRFPMSRSRVEALAEAWRDAVRHDEASGAGAELAARLLADVGDAKVLVVVAEGVLRTLPWSALPEARGPVVAHRDLLFLPNLFWEPGKRVSGPSLIAVDPDRDLAAAAREGRRLAAILPSPLLLSREAATRRALLSALPTASWFHFAGHAIVDEATPYSSGIELAGGARLTKMDVHGLSLSGPFVFLNACGAGKVARDGGGVLGIADGFLAAGARAVVATLWDLPDRGSAVVSDMFYPYLLDDGVAPWVAMSRVQRMLASQETSVSRQRSLWAAYQVLGSP